MITIGKVYTHVWSKYRPAILQLMMSSESGPQQYKLFSHEFKAMNPKDKYTFSLQAFQSRAVNNIRNSNIAQDLLEVLQQSRKATELMTEATYEFSLDKHFVLHVAKKIVEPEQQAEEVTTKESPATPETPAE